MELTKEIEVLVKEIMDLRGAKANYSMLNNLTRM